MLGTESNGRRQKLSSSPLKFAQVQLIRRNGQNCAITPDMMSSLIEDRINTQPFSQPTIRIVVNDITLSLDIKKAIGDKINILNIRDKLNRIMKSNIRPVFSCKVTLANIGNIPAQNIIIDGDVTYKVRRPLGYDVLPIHLPEFCDFLSPEHANRKFSRLNTSISYDNFVAKEIILDFFEGRKEWLGFPFLPLDYEMEDRSIWPSPRLSLRCLYSDTNAQHYCSEIQLFFHIYYDEKDKKLRAYKLSFGELGFKGISKISYIKRKEYTDNLRKKRYSAFDGKEHNDEMILLRLKEKSKKI